MFVTAEHTMMMFLGEPEMFPILRSRKYLLYIHFFLTRNESILETGE